MTSFISKLKNGDTDVYLSLYLSIAVFLVPFCSISNTIKQTGKYVALLELIFIALYFFRYGLNDVAFSSLRRSKWEAKVLGLFFLCAFYSFISLYFQSPAIAELDLRSSGYRLTFIFIHCIFFMAVLMHLKKSRFGGSYYTLAISCSCIVISLYFLYLLFFTAPMTGSQWFGNTPIGGHIRNISFFSLFGSSVCLAFILTANKFSLNMRLFIMVSGVFCLGLLFFSGGRATFLSIAFVVIILIIRSIKLTGFNFKMLSSVAFAYILAISVSGMLLDSPLKGVDRISGFIKSIGNLSTEKVFSDELTSGRTFLWKKAANSIEENPVMGTGPNGFRRIENINHVSPHNFILLFLVEWGVLGAGLLVALLLSAFNTIRKRLSDTTTEPYIIVGSILAIAGTTNAIFSGSYYHSQPTFYITLAFAIALSHKKI